MWRDEARFPVTRIIGRWSSLPTDDAESISAFSSGWIAVIQEST
jgi:hypothetical protein